MSDKINLDFSKETISGVNESLKSDLNNIAANIGITTSDLLRKKIREKVKAYPDEMLKKKTRSKKKQIVITGFSHKLRDEITNLSNNLGHKKTTLLIMFLTEIRDSFPEHMLKPPLEY